MKLANRKTTIFFFLLITQISLADVPLAIRAAFKKKFPAAEKVKWESAPGQFEAEFLMQEKIISALFDDNGNLLETEEQIRKEDLPTAVLQTWKIRFGDRKIKELKKVIRARSLVLYRFRIKDQEILFDAEGGEIEGPDGTETDRDTEVSE
jgi:hypothetical protein